MRDRAAPLYALLKDRRSIRRFRDQPVSDSVLRRLLQAATLAPSAHNRQPWRFVVVRDSAARASLAEAMGSRLRQDLESDGVDADHIDREVMRSLERIQGAPLTLVACLTMEAMDRYPDARRQEAERLMAVQSVAMAAMALLLAAHAEGLGACWLCAPLFASEAARESLSLPASWEPQGLILLGYPADRGRRRGRHPVEEVTLWR